MPTTDPSSSRKAADPPPSGVPEPIAISTFAAALSAYTSAGTARQTATLRMRTRPDPRTRNRVEWIVNGCAPETSYDGALVNAMQNAIIAEDATACCTIYALQWD